MIRRATLWSLIGLVIATGAAGLIYAHVQHNRPPFALGDTLPSVTDVSVVTSKGPLANNVVRALRDLGTGESIGRIALPHGHPQYVIGRFHVSAHHAPYGSQCMLFVIDNRTHQPVSLMWPVNAHHDTLTSGWDYGMGIIGQQFHWASPLAEEQTDAYGSAVDPTGIGWRTGPAEDFAFYAVLPRDAPPVTGRSDLTIGLAFMGPNRQPWGAMRLY